MAMESARELDRACAAVHEAVAALDDRGVGVPTVIRVAVAADVHLVPSVELAQALIVTAFDSSDPARWLVLAAEVAEACSVLRPGLSVIGLGDAGAELALLAEVNKRGELLLWAGVARSLLGEAEGAVELLERAASTFEFAVGRDERPSGPSRALHGRALEEAGEAAMAAGAMADAERYFERAASVYSSSQEVGRSLQVERRRNGSGDDVSEVAFDTGFPRGAATVLGTRAAMELRERIRGEAQTATDDD